MLVASTQIQALIAAVAAMPSASQGMRAMMERASEFDSPVRAMLTGIALDPQGRPFADQVLQDYWADEARQQQLLSSGSLGREVIIGGGFHAAVYAAARVLSGYPKPLVVERTDRVGGSFAMTSRPVFFLNSRNRAGTLGPAGDQGASLNYLPGAPIQASATSMTAYQTNADMAFVIRLALAQYADVVPEATVLSASDASDGVTVEVDGLALLRVGRVIDARGLGDPIDQPLANGGNIVTFPEFMQRMASRWPLRQVRRVAVIGGGDAGKCAVESLLGLAPQPFMAAAALDTVDRIDWYAQTLPARCEDWQQQIRGRYQAIGRYLRPDRSGLQRLTVKPRQARPVALPDVCLVEGRSYDLVVLATGNRVDAIDGLELDSFEEYATDFGVVARRHFTMPVFRIGPHAQLPFTERERQDGVADIAENAVAMFRTAAKTAALAAVLPGLADG
ncbi:hypothetical protein [Phytohabitans houttuyneae]|uniref:FAD/NAD(P)-binding domain-containing protein n=1 Tax=Phytohabitans houttuyneae TaxID=1076126 RepID=A0A6V8K193_9ACTN|nr:hypothetical protein [Phytohabitans houttuyneae]GFJ77464.1 hypothetical protein Phou_016440 [Phytohabitans houttuyneae]